MLFHGAYYSNYTEWLVDPSHIRPSAQQVWSIFGQEILNYDLGGYFQGLYITSGLFPLWRAQGLISCTYLKAASATALTLSFFVLFLSFAIMHIYPLRTSSRLFLPYQVAILGGLASVLWAGHLFHISLPLNTLIDSGVSPEFICSAQDLLSRDVLTEIFPNLSSTQLVALDLRNLSFSELSPSGCLPVQITIFHHLALGLVLIISGILSARRSTATGLSGLFSYVYSGWHAQLSASLLLFASLSFLQAHIGYALPIYPYMATDYATQVSLFTHHMWIGGFFMVGHGAHASIHMITELNTSSSRRMPFLVSLFLAQRDILLGHLVWVVIFLGFHSFGLYVHNDTMLALGRPEDTFSDNAIQLKPIFATLIGYSMSMDSTSAHSFYVSSLNNKIVTSSFEYGTSDFLIHHIHAFTIHTTALILVKGVAYSRSSRLVPDKGLLGFVYPCDGPGRGGTCQISSWDHFFLSVFWMYNSISIIIFHFFWKSQSEVWGSLKVEGGAVKVSHLTSGDFCINSSSINGWLRNFLWSEAAQVIQSYASSVAGYGLIFLGSHLLWAFSLMFLYSGRGYWQELIESILWSHAKLGFTPQIQPRALSITQGRAVGLAHYILGGIGCTWSFFISRMVTLS